MRLRLLLLVAALPALAAAQRTAPPVVSGQAPSLKVRKPTDLACKGMIGAIGDTVPLRATLTSKSDGKPVAGESVSFKVAGKVAGAATTGTTGEAKLDYKVPNDPPPGPHPMEARFAGDDEWGPSSVSANFGVFKSSTKIVFIAPPAGVNEGETATLGGKLTRITDQSGIHGREISMTVNGKSAGKVTTTNGGFTFSYPVPKPFPPKATVQAQFGGDVLYAATAATTEFAVKPPRRDALLTWPNAAGKIGETVTLKGTLFEKTVPFPKPVAGQKVRFWLTRSQDIFHLCEGVTDGNGKVSCNGKVKAPPGSFSLMAFADVDKEVWNVDRPAYANFYVAASPTHLALAGPATAHIGQSVSIKATLTRTTDNAPVGGVQVLMGGWKQTDASGVATFSFVMPSGATGPRVFKAESKPNDSSLKSEGSITINVTPAVN